MSKSEYDRHWYEPTAKNGTPEKFQDILIQQGRHLEQIRDLALKWNGTSDMLESNKQMMEIQMRIWEWLQQVIGHWISKLDKWIWQLNMDVQTWFNAIWWIMQKEWHLTRQAIKSNMVLAEGVWRWLNCIDDNLRNWFNTIWTEICKEWHLTRETIAQSTKLMWKIISSWFENVDKWLVEGFNWVNSTIEDMTHIFMKWLINVDNSIREGFFHNQNSIQKMWEYIWEIIHTWNLQTQKEMEFWNYLTWVLINEVVQSNQWLDKIWNSLLDLNSNIHQWRSEALIQHESLLSALDYLNQNAQLRHNEFMLSQQRLENELVWIWTWIQEVRHEITNVLHELSTKQKWYLEKYHAAEKLINNWFVDKAIEILSVIIEPRECPQHYSSHMALTECYVYKWNFEKALEHSRLAQIFSSDKNLKELSEITEIWVKYKQIKWSEEISGIYQLINIMDQTWNFEGFSDTKQILYIGLLYKAWLKDQAISKLAELMKYSREILFQLENIELFEDFFKWDHLQFIETYILKWERVFTWKIYFYSMNAFLINWDIENAKLALEIWIQENPAIFYANNVQNHPLVKQHLNNDLKTVILNASDINYWFVDLVAYYFFAKKYNLNNIVPSLEIRLKQEIKLSLWMLKNKTELFEISIMLGKDFPEFYNFVRQHSNIFN